MFQKIAATKVFPIFAAKYKEMMVDSRLLHSVLYVNNRTFTTPDCSALGCL